MPLRSCLAVSFYRARKRLVPVPDLRAYAAFMDTLILRPGNRLSATPVTAGDFKAIAALGGLRR